MNLDFTGYAARNVRYALYPIAGWIASQSTAIRWHEAEGLLMIDVNEIGSLLVGAAVYGATVAWSNTARKKGGAT